MTRAKAPENTVRCVVCPRPARKSMTFLRPSENPPTCSSTCLEIARQRGLGALRRAIAGGAP